MKLSQGKQSKSGKRGAERRIRMEERRKDGVCGTCACWLLLFSLLLFCHTTCLSSLFFSRLVWDEPRACARSWTNSLSKAGGGFLVISALSSPLYYSRMGLRKMRHGEGADPPHLDSVPAASQLTPRTRWRLGGRSWVTLQWCGLTVTRCPPPVFIPLRGLDTDLFRSVCLLEARHVTRPAFQNI